MNRCEHCQHWAHSPSRLVHPGFGVCSYSESMTNARYQQMALTTRDDEGFLGRDEPILLTKPEFGCSQWEQRDGQ